MCVQDALSPFWTWLRGTFLSGCWPLGGSPYSSAVVSLELGAVGALLPARYEMVDRLLLQVCFTLTDAFAGGEFVLYEC